MSYTISECNAVMCNCYSVSTQIGISSVNLASNKKFIVPPELTGTIVHMAVSPLEQSSIWQLVHWNNRPYGS